MFSIQIVICVISK